MMALPLSGWLVVVSTLMCVGHVQGWGTGAGDAGTYMTVPSLILFGDSTVDVGNNNFLDSMLRSDFLPYGRDFDTKSPTGRFTNGRMVADFVGETTLTLHAQPVKRCQVPAGIRNIVLDHMLTLNFLVSMVQQQSCS